MSKLGFSVTLTSFDSKSGNFRFEFENPLSISKSENPDILIIEFIEPELFVSRETGKPL